MVGREARLRCALRALVRFDPAAALWSPGRAGWAASDVDVAFAGERLFSIRVSGQTQAGCVPGRLTLREGAVDGRPRARLSWRPSEYTGGLTLSPSGQLAFLYTSPVMSEFGDSGLLIVDLVRGRFGGEVRAAKGAAWWSDSEIIAVDDTSRGCGALQLRGALSRRANARGHRACLLGRHRRARWRGDAPRLRARDREPLGVGTRSAERARSACRTEHGSRPLITIGGRYAR